MTGLELLRAAAAVLDAKKAHDIRAIRVEDLTIVAGYFLFASATSTTQAKSLADELEFQLKGQGVTPSRVEGYQSAQWILLDYGEVIVHIFYGETREFYSLERLWADGEQVDLSDILTD